MLRGFYQAIRNPRSHEKTTDSEDDAQVLILFIGYLVQQIDKAKSQFSRADFQKRVFDPDFVPQERYAQLLVDEIPVGQRFEVFLDIYRAKESGKPQHLRHFFSVLLKRLTEDELRQVYDVLSEELKIADDEVTIRMVIGSFDGDVWPHIDEAARLRVENRLVRSVREGRFDRHQRSCRGGALATWATRLLPYFSLKRDLLHAVWDKLRSGSDEEEDYIFEYLFASLKSLAESMPSYIASTIRTKLEQGNGRFHDAMLVSCPWDRKTWTPELGKAFDEFRETQETLKDFDGDIPF